MTDTTRPDPAAAPDRLELALYSSRPAPADRDLGRPILDSPPMRGSIGGESLEVITKSLS
ncbi:hypothetical protein OG500_38060 [Kitasatospora sp. NBC_01250]|uniref:hypothetical protein n=1 Tax=Kitasatospora sp. NBC_01250 TaxID=2903571 RepID=UPI002E359457|nr:hypothetical protein [Kitasatospora sp. NBC_01250]